MWFDLSDICGKKYPEDDDDYKRLCGVQCLALQQLAGADGKGVFPLASSLSSRMVARLVLKLVAAGRNLAPLPTKLSLNTKS